MTCLMVELTNRTWPSEAAHSLSDDTDIASAAGPDATAFPPPAAVAGALPPPAPVSVKEILQLESTKGAVIANLPQQQEGSFNFQHLKVF